jgi:ornithine cyclodeaminase/alanine dehydrogenase-like protein (mu-crystallin family)
MLALSEGDLIGLLPPRDIVAAVETALRADAVGNVVAPRRHHMQWKDTTLLTMPAAAEGGIGVKVISVAPDNAARNLPVTNGIMLLHEGATGLPLTIMNAAALTAQRTGAVGALGMKYLTPPETCSVGIVGCGVQGAWQAIFAHAVRPISEVFAFTRSNGSFERFVATVTRHVPDAHVTRCMTVHELLERTDLVVTATTATEPVLPNESKLLENKHFISVGSYKPTMQELPDAVYRLARHLAVDSPQASDEVGDIINPLQRGILKQTDVFLIGECVTGKRIVDTARTTVYKSVGAAMYDLFVAQALYAAAKTRDLGCEVSL